MGNHIGERQLQLVRDCMTFRLTDAEALVYCEKMGRKISQRTLTRTKTYLKSDQSVQTWLNEYSRIGFALQHRQHLDEVERLQEPLWRMYISETSKPDVIRDPNDTAPNPEERRLIPNPAKNKFLIMRLSERLEELTKTKSALNLGNPVIAAIKMKMGDTRQHEEEIAKGFAATGI